MQETSGSRKQAGFTMIELAIALFLLALIFGGIAAPLHAQVEMRKAAQTKHILDEARMALLGYAAANGHLPCPADEGSVGQEAPGTNHESGHCPTYFGFLPAAALGMGVEEARGFAVDAWGSTAHRIRYAVSPYGVGAVPNAFTRVNGIRSAGIVRLSDPSLSLFHVCDSASGVSAGANCGKAVTLVSSTPAVIWSSGANAATGGASLHEAQNPNVNGGSADRLFVSAVHSDAPGAEFDDHVAWLPMSVLLHRLLAAGHLP
jgi:prepilin-type N-terminal cleavage/methylation domain-containing protein